MPGIRTVAADPRNIVAGVQSTIRWDTDFLQYHFVTDNDAADVLNDPEVNQIFNSRPGLQFNYASLNAFPLAEQVITDSTIRAATEADSFTNISLLKVSNYADSNIHVFGVEAVQQPGQTSPLIDLRGVGFFPGVDEDERTFITNDFESHLIFFTDNVSPDAVPDLGAASSASRVALHEFGHTLGLNHPHDTGGDGRSLQTTSRAIVDPNDIATDNERYTVMSYEQGGLDDATTRTFGHAASYMAIDIAALQAMYGRSERYEDNNVYTLTDPLTAALDTDGDDGDVSIGEAWYSIWDTGGIDSIEYDGEHRVLINLNDATLSPVFNPTADRAWIADITSLPEFAALPTELQQDLSDPEFHAGGYFSRIFRDDSSNFRHGEPVVLGGFSIAARNGEADAVIELALGGANGDFLIGNEVANVLQGFEGDDVMHGARGDDTLIGGNASDVIYGGEGDDVLYGDQGDLDAPPMELVMG